MKIAIIGSGIAAFEAAKTARSLSADAEITIYSREAVLPYRRPALSRMAAVEVADAQFYIKPVSFYEENRISLELSRTLVSIDTAAKSLSFDSGSPAGYDKLLLAAGAHCFYPPVPGMDLDGVMSLREYSDLQKLRARLDAGVKSVAVIGGGLLGLELAQSLLERSCCVTVIEGFPILLPRNLDEEAATAVQEMLSKIGGLTLRFGHCVGAVAGKDGRAVGVELAGGTVPAELVMVSAGVRSNIGVASAAGIKCCRGIVVDRFMRTSAADVYAAGDCAEVEGVSYGLYEAARMMGAAAARNMLGDEQPFVPQAYPARLSVFGLKVFSAGHLSGARCETAYDPGAGTFKKLFYDEKGQLAGCILVGDLREAVKLQSQIVVSRA
ncbi:MAG: NAD(P)/FAD-dependent oxidoreductase [Lentisphaeria bacterium]|nr:NAD(P)/FAD-dependent oxidoreductase [Lentisphaeria bacterium]